MTVADLEIPGVGGGGKKQFIEKWKVIVRPKGYNREPSFTEYTN